MRGAEPGGGATPGRLEDVAGCGRFHPLAAWRGRSASLKLHRAIAVKARSEKEVKLHMSLYPGVVYDVSFLQIHQVKFEETDITQYQVHYQGW